MPAPIEFVKGKEYNDLTTIELLPSTNGTRMVLCKCKCGNIISTSFKRIRNGDTKSCGCYRKQVVAAKNYKHGQSIRENISPEYTAWKAMRARCSKEDPRYKGRGIIVNSIFDDFQIFLKEVGKKPGSKYTIERIDNNKGYEIGNIKWATNTEQARNKRNTLYVSCDGELVCLATLAEQYSIPYSYIYSRLRTYDTIEDIIEEYKNEYARNT